MISLFQIACVSPAASSLSESVNTLRYAARAKKIRTQPFVIMDPREAMILNLKKRVDILTTENSQLRSLLQNAGPSAASRRSSGGQAIAYPDTPNGDIELADTQSISDLDDFTALDSRPSSQRSKKTLRQVSSLLFISTPTSSGKAGKKKLEDLDSSTLVDLIKDYMIENEELRRDNYELMTVRDMVMRDQEMVCMENEKLIKKVEECEQFHSFGGRSKISDLVRHRRQNGSNTSLPEMVNNNNNVMRQLIQYDSSSADDEIKSRESSGDLPYTLRRELERRRIRSGRRKLFSADSEESFDDATIRDIAVKSRQSGHSSKRRQRSRRPNETHL